MTTLEQKITEKLQDELGNEIQINFTSSNEITVIDESGSKSDWQHNDGDSIRQCWSEEFEGDEKYNTDFDIEEVGGMYTYEIDEDYYLYKLK
jgi:hypothetical protein